MDLVEPCKDQAHESVLEIGQIVRAPLCCCHSLCGRLCGGTAQLASLEPDEDYKATVKKALEAIVDMEKLDSDKEKVDAFHKLRATADDLVNKGLMMEGKILEAFEFSAMSAIDASDEAGPAEVQQARVLMVAALYLFCLAYKSKDCQAPDKSKERFGKPRWAVARLSAFRNALRKQRTVFPLCINLDLNGHLCCCAFSFFFSSRRRHTRCSGVSWARRCV